jgi:predicted DNA-binding protein with PD1-like motif
MQCISGSKYGRCFFISLDRGEDVLISLRKLIAENSIRNAVLVSGIGTLESCVTHYVSTTGREPVDVFAPLENRPLELDSIQGIIADGVPHFHMVVSEGDRTYAGHMEEGCRVLYLFEAVILEVEDVALTRRVKEYGIKRLEVK